jgi:hypothetical protein
MKGVSDNGTEFTAQAGPVMAHAPGSKNLV